MSTVCAIRPWAASVPAPAVPPRQCAATPFRGELSELELEIHIEDCAYLWRMAYERFLQFGSPHDRDEALLHLHRMNEAILARSPEVQEARHAAFERQLRGQGRYVP